MPDDMKRFLRSVEHDADISVSAEDGWQVIDVRNETGKGRMLFTSVLPGVYFTYNDFDMAECITDFAAPEGRYLGITIALRDALSRGCRAARSHISRRATLRSPTSRTMPEPMSFRLGTTVELLSTLI